MIIASSIPYFQRFSLDVNPGTIAASATKTFYTSISPINTTGVCTLISAFQGVRVNLPANKITVLLWSVLINSTSIQVTIGSQASVAITFSW
jgi:hypothetical protein